MLALENVQICHCLAYCSNFPEIPVGLGVWRTTSLCHRSFHAFIIVVWIFLLSAWKVVLGVECLFDSRHPFHLRDSKHKLRSQIYSNREIE